MKLITDSFYKEGSGFVTVSRKTNISEPIVTERLKSFSDEGVEIEFSPVNEYIKTTVKEAFGVDFSTDPEAYAFELTATSVKIFAETGRAKIYALYSLTARCDGGKAECCTVYSTPKMRHRSVRVFLPPKRELGFFKSYLDFIVELGYNTLVLEIGGAMEFEKHPEINETWAEYCKSMKEFNEKVYVAQDAYKRVKNSIHTFNADGDIYSKAEVKEIVKWCKERCIEVIPEIPSLSHSEYILISHPEMRECDDEDYASTACPQNEEFYKLVFELYDEAIEVFEPETLHIGHDEWWVMCICDKCKGKNAAELFAYNVNRLYDYLKSKGVKTMMWADKLKAVTDKNGECHGAARKEIYSLPTKRKIDVMGKEHTVREMHWFKPSEEAKEKGFLHVIENTEAAIDMIPKDIICMNWYHSIDPEINDIFLRKGFPSIYANCNPGCLGNIKKRIAFGAEGISVSSWTVTREHDFQLWQGGMTFHVGYGALICWEDSHDEMLYEKNADRVRRQLYLRRNAEALHSHHLTAVHRLTAKIPELEGYFTGSLPYCEEDKLTLGEYVVTYENGEEEKFPVLYSVNLSIADVKTGRCESEGSWVYATDPRLNKVVPSALPKEYPNGFAYECVFKLKGKAKDVKYVARSGRESAVEVLEIKA